MPQNIDGVEIFSTGLHRGSETITITEKDLDEMVHSFIMLGGQEGFRPVLKLGHEDAQAFFGSRKGAPNLGFISKIWKVGGKILANFSNVPDALVDLIKQRRYNAVSIEMFAKTEFNGTNFFNVLTAVALLGAELPAVKGLKELAATLFTDEVEVPFSGDTLELTSPEKEDMPFTQEQVDGLVNAAVVKAVADVKAEFEATKTELNGKVETAEAATKTAEAATKTAESALRTYEDDTRKVVAEKMVDDAIKDGRLTPAQKDEALAFALNLSGTVKFGDKEKSAADVFKSFIEGLPKKVDFGEHGAGGDDENKKPESAGHEVDLRAKKLVSEGKVKTYAEGRTMVLDQNPTLKRRYFEMED